MRIHTQAGEFERTHFELATAEELLTQLSPLHPWWHRNSQQHPASWLFRGQSNAAWGLTPSLLRPGAIPPGPEGSGNRRRFEVLALREFIQRVDEQGLFIPEDSQELRDPTWRKYALDSYEEMSSKGYSMDEVWPPLNQLSNLALAQHYGIPTVLLDWCRRPLVAAYFAAADAAARPHGGRLSVWIIREIIVQKCCSNFIPQALVVTAPYASNPNLRAQQGVFTVVRTTGYDPPPNIDEVLSHAVSHRLADYDVAIGWNLPDLCKFTVPASEAPKLLRLLAMHGMTAASVFPGYAGVVLAMNERRLWDEPYHEAFMLP